MYTVLSLWRESLGFFKPDRLKIFFLLTLNALRGVYVTVARHALWAPLVFLVPAAIAALLDVMIFTWGPVLITLFTALMLMLSVGFSLLLFIFISAARSSVDPKNAHYFSDKIKRFFFPFALSCGIAQIIFVLWLRAGIDVSAGSSTGAIVLLKNVFYSRPIQDIVMHHVWILLIVFGFFRIDAGSYRDTRRYAAGNALRMMVYRYPIFLFLMLFNAGALFAWFEFTGFIASFLLPAFVEMIILCCVNFVFLLGFMVPFSIVMISNVYMKNVYEYAKIYSPF